MLTAARPVHDDSTPPTDPAAPRRLLRRVIAAVFVAGCLHAGLYAVSFPPWAIEDEEQHVDYAWKLSFDREMPTIEHPLDQSIIDSVVSTDRWGNYGYAPPPGFTPETMGMEGWSYEAYHPPLPYLGLAVVAQPFGDRALVVMYALRGVTVVAAGLTGALTALLAWTWCRDPRRRLPAAVAAGTAAALLPAMADSGGRVNGDIFAALAVVAGMLLVQRWLDRPTAGRAWAVGGLLAAAALTRETAFVLGVPVAAAGVVAARRGTLRVGDVGRALGPPLVAVAAWLGYHWRESGYLDPADAVRARHGSHHPYLGFADWVGDLNDRAFVPFLVHWPLPRAFTVLVAAVLVAGLALAVRRGAVLPAVVAAGAVALLLGLLFHEALADSTTVTARLLLPAYPPVIAASVVGWSGLRRAPWATLTVPAAVAMLSGVFLVGSFLPRFPPGLG
ncbi:MAG TPA: hypothetical protein VFI47_26315 [Acidimicrobiales bacterium]|nr:hypothetical protein [Acidimicrobiales bacterium]